MANLKVIVPKLNKRLAPVSNFADKSNVIGMVRNGFTFEGTPRMNGPDQWYQDRDGYYYWSKGLMELPDPGAPAAEDDLETVTAVTPGIKKPVPPPPQAINFAGMFSGLGAEGEGIKVAVLDFGFFDHPAFNGEVKLIRDFTDSGGTGADGSGHGTHIAGIIGARFNDPQLPVLGVAPKCELIIGKVVPDISGPGMGKLVADGVGWAVTNGAKIINLSLFVSGPEIAALQPAIQAAAKAGVILISAAGDVKGLDNGKVKYPAAEFASCISVADVTATYLEKNPAINPQINFLSGFSNYVSTSLDDHGFYESMLGSSMATAFLTGITARILSQWKKQGRDISKINKDDILPELKKIVVPKTNLNFQDMSNFKIALV